MAKYSNVSVETIYQDLITICKNEENVSPYQSYVTLRNIFYLFLDDKTRDVGFSFSGPFAKMDYLAKESHLSKNVFRALNHFRSKIRSLKSYHDDELRRTFLYDVRLFSEFVSCVCQTAVPDALLKLLPNDLWVESSRVERPVSEYIRVVVDHWNEQYIYAEMADELGDDVVVCYAYSTEAGDLTLNGKLLEKGVQLNLIRPKLRENIYYPDNDVFQISDIKEADPKSSSYTPYSDEVIEGVVCDKIYTSINNVPYIQYDFNITNVIDSKDGLMEGDIISVFILGGYEPYLLYQQFSQTDYVLHDDCLIHDSMGNDTELFLGDSYLLLLESGMYGIPKGGYTIVGNTKDSVYTDCGENYMSIEDYSLIIPK